MGKKKIPAGDELMMKASLWLGRELSSAMRYETELVIYDLVRGFDRRRNCGPASLDLERRLALALEAYGEVVRRGDENRVEAIIDELEVSRVESQRPKVRPEYEDPIEQREHRRQLMRMVAGLKKQLEKLDDKTSPEAKELEAQIGAWEEFI